MRGTLVNRLRAVLDGKPPAVAVSFQNAKDTTGDMLADEAINAGVDIAELRIDRFPQHDPHTVLEYIAGFHGIPTLATIRSAAEGGDWRESEQQRLKLFQEVIPSVDGVDVELSSHGIAAAVVQSAKAADRVAVVSYHNFVDTPEADTLQDLLDSAVSISADYVKISTMAKTLADIQTLAGLLLANRTTPLIVIAMGATGTLSRIFFPALGSRMTFSSIGGAFAPGQMDYEETFHMLRKFYPEYNNTKTLDVTVHEGA